MAIQALINVLLAALWMMLSDTYTFGAFVFGYLFGILFIIAALPLLPGNHLYLRPVWKAFVLGLIFMKELILANIDVIRIVIQKEIHNKPAFFAYPTELKHDWEVALLSQLITLTPGTIVVAISDDQKTLYIHSIDFSDIDSEISAIKDSFEKAIKEVSIR
ncbi:Na+/H+ antiporter subunit E [Mammaliicoccus stepanovicii]|uniref:Monovalent cation/H+ antiporter subunit E n=1 Tax=Mammaliicoccus stepanovicii TaxID=643214 RepID=A0A239ZUD9_9STAP|nr:Na+/H+ antiporter subunit E [Mammaliicoccus stepanovicii]PNZ77502.1 Na+/H+ antiporter subunit E [Mammaliicoccus stepanovicii]GGI38935.1 Na(+)/H(+) antiporter subunit E1 [Mammaliicoccus stepanovicii]SNV74490.1 monovalent cation/H+ antiporter subunit E [Mammaliicoccus stepanovicii]